MNVNYEINRDEIRLVDRRNEPYSKVIGFLTEADENYIYGIVYNPKDLYDERKESFSMEIHYEDLG